MPLREAYRSDDPRKRWFGFNLTWACIMLQQLNLRVLSQDYCASLDVFNPREMLSEFGAVPDQTISQVTPDRGFPPLPILSTEAAFVDPGSNDLIVQYEGTKRTVATVLVAHPEYTLTEFGRKAFAVKCARWLQRGTNLVVINASVPTDLNSELMALLGCTDKMTWKPETGLSAVCYRIVAEKLRNRFDVWANSLALGEPLPTVPLWLEADLAVPLDLELTFNNACKSLRIA